MAGDVLSGPVIHKIFWGTMPIPFNDKSIFDKIFFITVYLQVGACLSHVGTLGIGTTCKCLKLNAILGQKVL
jgi:hypothetical protein